MGQNVVKTPEEVLKALHDRLDEINLETQREWREFQENAATLDIPKDPPERVEEIASIHQAIERQHKYIADLEAAEEAKKAEEERENEKLKKLEERIYKKRE